MPTRYALWIQIVVTILASLLVATGLAYLNRWYTVPFSIYSIIAVVAAFIFVAIAFLVKRRSSEKGGQSGKVFFLLALFCGLQYFAPAIADEFHYLEVQRATQFIESLMPRLEEYHSEHSGYPETIDILIRTDEKVPPLLQFNNTFFFADNRNFYRRIDDAQYEFRFSDPNGWIGYQYTFCCDANGKWTITD